MVKVKVKPFFISFCIENVTVTNNPESRRNKHWTNKVLMYKDIQYLVKETDFRIVTGK